MSFQTGGRRSAETRAVFRYFEADREKVLNSTPTAKITGHALYRRTSGVCMRTLEAVRRCRDNRQLIVEGHIIGIAEIDMTHGT